MNWIAEIDKITDDAKRSFAHLSKEQLNWKPNSNTWSIAQNLDHLIVINESYYPVLAALNEGRYQPPFVAKIGFLVSLFGKTILNSVKPDRRKKMKTFPVWEPNAGIAEKDILYRFETHQQELKQKIEKAKKHVANGVVISSPANKNIVYKLDAAFDIIVTHEQRHIEQAKEILSHQAFT